MNTTYYKRVRSTSQISMIDILIKRNNIDEKWEFYLVIDFTPKSNINKYHELIGRRITDIIEVMPDRGFDENMFQTKIEDVPIENIKFDNNDWELISVK